MKMSLDKITLDERLQHRELLNDAMILELKEAYKNGDKVEPIVLIFDGERHWMPDGHHRYYGCKAALCDTIEANVFDGDFRAAWLYSLGVNANHGMRRSAADLQRVLDRAFDDGEVSKWTDSKIALMANCTVGQVRHHRKGMQEVAQGRAMSALLPDDPNALTDPVVVRKSLSDEAKRKQIIRKAQRVYCQLANVVEELGLWDILTPHLAAIKKHTGVV